MRLTPAGMVLALAVEHAPRRHRDRRDDDHGAAGGISIYQALYFFLGWLVVALALLSPLHDYAERLPWAHMVQHEALMVGAAPLFWWTVLGRETRALADQQLAGLAMWVPAGLAYPLAALVLLSRSLCRCAT